MLAMIDVSMGGRAAEEIYLGVDEISSGIVLTVLIANRLQQ
jgi:ATP-dependent Zn protease